MSFCSGIARVSVVAHGLPLLRWSSISFIATSGLPSTLAVLSYRSKSLWAFSCGAIIVSA